MPIGVLLNPSFRPAEGQLSDLREAARTIGLPLHLLRASTDRGIDAAFESVAQHRIPALLVASDPFFEQRSDKLVGLAARHVVPAIYDTRNSSVAGGLMSYGPSFSDAVRQVGIYTGRILKGDKPMGTSNNTRFRSRLQRSCRGESPVGDRFDAWPASARSFARCHTESTRERTQAGAAAIRSS